VQKFLASPTPRAALVLCKGFSAGIRTLSQAAIVYGLRCLLGVKLDWRPLSLLNVVVVVVLLDAVLDVFADHRVHCEDARTVSWESPSADHAAVLCEQCDLPHHHHARLAEAISHLNPLTYVVDALRTSMLAGSTSTFSLSQDYAVIVLTTARLVFHCFALISGLQVDRLSLGLWSSMHVLERHGPGRRGSAGFLNAHPVPPMLRLSKYRYTTGSCIDQQLAHNHPPMMVMPRPRSSDPVPLPSASGKAAQERGHGGHSGSAEAQPARSTMES